LAFQYKKVQYNIFQKPYLSTYVYRSYYLVLQA
jgi:hypothetical protein